MALDLALTLRYQRAGDGKMLDDTARGVGQLGEAAKNAAQPTKDVATGLGEIESAAPTAKTAVEQIGTAVATVKSSFSGWEAAALGGIAGIAASFGSALLETAVSAAIDMIGGYFDQITNSATNIAEDIEAHKTLIGSIKGLWEQNKTAASDYGAVSLPAMRFEAQDNVGRLSDDYDSSLRRFVLDSDVTRKAPEPFKGLLAGLREDLADGKADIVAWYTEVAQIGETLELDDPARDFVRKFRDDSEQVREVQVKLNEALDAYAAVTGNAEAATRAFGENGAKLVEIAGQYEAALPVMREFAALQAAIGAGGTTDTIGAAGGFSFSDIAGSGLGPAAPERDFWSIFGFAGGGTTGTGPTNMAQGVELQL